MVLIGGKLLKKPQDFKEKPQVLVVSDSCICSSHGTGAVVLRHFSGYPSDRLSNAYYQEGRPAWENSVRYRVKAPRPKGLPRIFYFLIRGYNFLVRHLGISRFYYNHHWEFLCDYKENPNIKFTPDVIYSVVYSPFGLSLVEWLIKKMPAHIPLIQYFMDYNSPNGFNSSRYLNTILERAQEVWALTDEIAFQIGGSAAAYGKPVRVQPAFHLEVSSCPKKTYTSEYSRIPRCVIVGNFYLPQMAAVVKRVWRRVQGKLPSLGPIQWYCRPEAVELVVAEIGDLGPEIQPVRYFAYQELIDRLMEADCAIIPFNARKKPENDYARFSLPSRLTELFSIGLPVFCIASDQTPLARYVTKNKIGLVCDAEDEIRLAERLVAFIKNRKHRVKLGLKAREFAVREFPLGPFQDFLYHKLSDLASRSNVVLCEQ
jgi:glycosyltransferase involved in cell wall biosynthesis